MPENTQGHTLNLSPAGVLPDVAEMSLLPSLLGESVSSPPGGMPSFLILLAVELKAWPPVPLDLSTVIILTSDPQHLHPIQIYKYSTTSQHLFLCMCFCLFLSITLIPM